MADDGIWDWRHERMWEEAGCSRSEVTAVGGPCLYTTSMGSSFGSQHIVYITADRHVRQLYFDGSWACQDLSAQAQAMDADPTGGLVAYWWPDRRSEHILYRGQDGHVHQLFFNGQWHHENLSGSLGAPRMDGYGGLAGHVWQGHGSQHVYYRSVDGHIHELWFDRAWHHGDLSAATGADADNSGALCSFAWEQAGSQHVLFRGSGGRVFQLYFQTDWVLQDLTATAGVSGNGLGAANRALAGCVWPGASSQHVLYARADGQDSIEQLYFRGEWTAQHLSAISQAAPGVDGNASGIGTIAAFVWESHHSQHVIYQAGGRVLQLYFAGADWELQDLSARWSLADSAPSDAAGARLSAAIWPERNSQHIVYTNRQGELLQLYFDQHACDRRNWMGQLGERIESRRLEEVLILGSHDSGAFSRFMGSAVRTQTLDLGQQLLAGVRCFDLRIMWREQGWDGVRNSFYLCHGTDSARDLELRPQLEKIVDFAAHHPREIIILDVHRTIDIHGEQLDDARVVELARLFSEVLDRQVSKIPAIRFSDFWEDGRNIVVFFPNTNVNDTYGFRKNTHLERVWDPYGLSHNGQNERKTRSLKAHIEQEVPALEVDTLANTMACFWSLDIASSAPPLNREVHGWVKTWWGISEFASRLNIVSVDFVEESNPIDLFFSLNAHER